MGSLPSRSADPWRALFVSWGKLHRADTIASRLGIPSITIRHLHRGYRGSSLTFTAFRYLLQALHTLLSCAARRPRIVFVTHPPLFAAATVWLYCLVFRARYVIDFHSGCFIQEHWRRLDRWQRALARRAALNLVHNADNARVVEGWGAPYEVLPSLPPELARSPPPTFRPERERSLVVYICSFKEDEPYREVIDAARDLPNVDFAVTGRAPDELRERLPPNIRLTGFLPEGDYLALLGGADLILALTLRSGTLVYGAQEAISLHKPLVLSSTETLRSYFGKAGVVFSENTGRGLSSAVEEALRRRGELSTRMGEFHRAYLEEGEARLRRIRERLGVARDVGPTMR